MIGTIKEFWKTICDKFPQYKIVMKIDETLDEKQIELKTIISNWKQQ
jgi:hypothetical protein